MPKGLGELPKFKVLQMNQNKIKQLYSEFHLMRHLKSISLDWFLYTFPPLPSSFSLQDMTDVMSENYQQNDSKNLILLIKQLS